KTEDAGNLEQAVDDQRIQGKIQRIPREYRIDAERLRESRVSKAGFEVERLLEPLGRPAVGLTHVTRQIVDACRRYRHPMLLVGGIDLQLPAEMPDAQPAGPQIGERSGQPLQVAELAMNDEHPGMQFPSNVA